MDNKSFFIFISLILNCVHCFDEFYTRIITIPSNGTQEMVIFDKHDKKPPDWVEFIHVSCHSQLLNITLFNDNNSINGLNVGLVLFTKSDFGNVFVNNNNSDDVNVMMVVRAHGDNDPVPGGCNKEFLLEISPFLRLFANQIIDTLEYQYASIDTPQGYKPVHCDDAQFLINYDIYAYYLNENDFSESEYFRALKLMSNESTIVKHAAKVNPILQSPKTRVYFWSYRGRGVVYNIISSSNHYQSAYTPIITYNCDDFQTCGKINLFAIIIAVVLGIFGLYITLRGHQAFNYQMIFFGFLGGSFPAYILLLKYSNLLSEERALCCLSIGLFGAFFWLSVWKVLKLPLLSLLLSGLSLGFLIMSTILFTCVGNLYLFQNEINYWIIIICGMLIITIILMLNAVLLSIISSSIVGAYVAVVAFDRFVDGSLSYIIINVIKRAGYEYNAINNVAFQDKDIVLSVIWCLLSIMGILLQLYQSVGRPSFPSSSPCSHPQREPSHRRHQVHRQNSNRLHQRRTPRFNEESIPDARVINERQPLLYNGHNQLYGPPPQYSQVTRQYDSI